MHTYINDAIKHEKNDIKGFLSMGIADRDYMHKGRKGSLMNGKRHSPASRWAKLRFSLWLIIRRITGR
jgi:hypothetical protein